MSPIFAAKQYAQGPERLFAACDEACLGETYREGKLKLHVDPRFYDGDRIDAETFHRMFRTATVANLVGERCVQLAIDLGFVDPAMVMRIDGVPHAQWTLLM